MLKGQFACDDRDLVQARAALEEAGRQARAANDIALRAGCEQLNGLDGATPPASA